MKLNSLQLIVRLNIFMIQFKYMINFDFMKKLKAKKFCSRIPLPINKFAQKCVA